MSEKQGKHYIHFIIIFQMYMHLTQFLFIDFRYIFVWKNLSSFLIKWFIIEIDLIYVYNNYNVHNLKYICTFKLEVNFSWFIALCSKWIIKKIPQLQFHLTQQLMF